MKREGSERSTERVEMISGDPQLFDTSTPGSEPAKAPAAHRRRVDPIALGGVLLVVVVAVAVAWPRSSGSSPASPSTTATVPSSAGPSPTTVPGRDAPVPSASTSFALTVEPSPVVLGTPVTMLLDGDLSGVASPISAVAWVDEQVSGMWRTIYWMARSSDTSQEVGAVSNDLFEKGPDAVTYRADQPVQYNVDALTSGSYRLCRYVSLLTRGTSSLPSSNPAYVCAPLVVDHALHTDAETPTS